MLISLIVIILVEEINFPGHDRRSIIYLQNKLTVKIVNVLTLAGMRLLCNYNCLWDLFRGTLFTVNKMASTGCFID